MTPRDAALAMLDSLERERGMILSGRVADLGRLLPEKERLSKHLNRLQDPELTARLQDEARRNAALLDAAAKGVRSAIDRIQDIRSQAGRLNTYARDGSRVIHPTTVGALEKRA